MRNPRARLEHFKKYGGDSEEVAWIVAQLEEAWRMGYEVEQINNGASVVRLYLDGRLIWTGLDHTGTLTTTPNMESA